MMHDVPYVVVSIENFTTSVLFVYAHIELRFNILIVKILFQDWMWWFFLEVSAWFIFRAPLVPFA